MKEILRDALKSISDEKIEEIASFRFVEKIEGQVIREMPAVSSFTPLELMEFKRAAM